ncbi:efflux RND transporter permease subunit, partial [bacterium]|nr:efflux RND transporter permease subunit [bacterium]
MFSQIFIERPRLAMVISLVLLFAGAIAIPNIPVAEYPEIAPPQIYVGCSYAGASAQVVQETIAVPLEAEINGVEHLLYFTSSCDDNGSYSCSIVFQPGIDYDMAMVNVQNAVKRAEAKLPDEVKKVGVNIYKRSGDFLCVYCFLSDNDYSLLDLNNFVNTTIKDAISRLEGVASVAVFGERVYSMRIWLDPFRMAGLNITTANIIAAIQSQNIQAAAGTVGTESSNEYIEYKIDMKGRLLTTEEFGDIVLRTEADGSMVKISDVARVELGSRSYAGQGLLDGKPGVGMAAFRTSDANALDTVNNINKLLEEYKPRFPEGVYYQVAFDPTKFIKVTIQEIVETLVIALILVIVITYLFLQDWRATIVPAVAIPVSLLATFPVIYVIGYSINVLTMFGLILVIGSLVDDAIVVVENCQSLMEREGLNARDAASKSMQQITGAIIATTLVTVACYVPLAFYGGMVGNIYRQFSVTMCVSLCFSTLVALTLSPALCSLILRPPRKKALWIFAPFNLILNCSRSIYLFVVKLLVRRGIITVLLFAACCYLAYRVHGKIPSAFLPTEDKGVILCNVELSPGATLSRTDKALEAFRESVKDVPGIKTCFSVSGQNIVNGNGENYGMLIVQLTDWEERKTKDLSLTAILQKVQAAAATIPSATVNCFTPPAIMGLGATGGVSFKICSDSDSDPVKLSGVAKKMSYELTMKPETLYVMSSFNADTPQIYFDLDREKAQSLNVSVASVFATLQSKLASYYINDFTMNGENYFVKIQAEADERSSIENIDELMIPSQS